MKWKYGIRKIYWLAVLLRASQINNHCEGESREKSSCNVERLTMERLYIYWFTLHSFVPSCSANLKLQKIMNEKMSKRRIEIRELQKQEIEEKQERRLLIRLHIFYLILLINLWTKNEKKTKGSWRIQRMENDSMRSEFLSCNRD